MAEVTDGLRLEGVYRRGYGVIPKFVMHDGDLSLESKAIYAYLCALAGSGDTTFPYRETILGQLKLAKNTYYNHYKPLIDQGYITVERPADKKAANIYTLVANPKKLAEAAAVGEGRLRYRGLKAQGYGTLPRTVMQDSRLTVKAKGLYAYFCSYCGGGDCAFPRKDHILFHLGISEPTYYKALSQLKELEYLQVTQRKEGGRFAVNDYYLNEFPGEPGRGSGGKASAKAPYPNFCDTEKCDIEKRDIEKRDTKKRDAKNCDALLRADRAKNKLSINSPSREGPLEALAVDCVAALLDKPAEKRSAKEKRAAEWLAGGGQLEKALTGFLPEFRRSVQGRSLRKPQAYFAAALWDWMGAQEVRQALETGPRGASYDLGELERWIEQGVG